MKFPFPPAPLAIWETACLGGGGGGGAWDRVQLLCQSSSGEDSGARVLHAGPNLPAVLEHRPGGLVERNSLADILWDGTGLQSRERERPSFLFHLHLVDSSVQLIHPQIYKSSVLQDRREEARVWPASLAPAVWAANVGTAALRQAARSVPWGHKMTIPQRGDC